MPLLPPAVDSATLPPKSVSAYPEPYRSRVLPREKRALGDACGLTKVGVNLTTLLPGKESSMRHWHTHEDEFVFVIAGEVVLRTNAGEQVLKAGECAGFPAGREDGHQFINRGDSPVRYLEVSNRDAQDMAHYSDPAVDLTYAPHLPGKFCHRDGTPY